MPESTFDYENYDGPMLQSPYQGPKKEADRETLDEGMHSAIDGHHWVEHHREAFLAMFNHTKSLMMLGKRHYLNIRLMYFCLENSIDSSTEEYSIPGASLLAVIKRYFILLDPSLGDGFIKLHCSAVDYYGLYPVSWMDLKVA